MFSVVVGRGGREEMGMLVSRVFVDCGVLLLEESFSWVGFHWVLLCGPLFFLESYSITRGGVGRISGVVHT